MSGFPVLVGAGVAGRVRTNIAAFGGNPDEVTIASAMSVAALLAMPHASGLKST